MVPRRVCVVQCSVDEVPGLRNGSFTVRRSPAWGTVGQCAKVQCTQHSAIKS